ncbi:L-type lectin-domain containing receptor kinase IX.1 [Zea mays]|uniref:L-type lectin-domain containing receptor kinase IX.1 n=1 Tax=Zea mays TaxID=4577 RepID=A0A3L6FZC9_MAIZE|nr:L-type lectin-domain containing receptor kinase IX.1 [Zea mays]
MPLSTTSMALTNLCSCPSSRAHQLQLLCFCLALSLHVPYHANSLSFSYSFFNPDDFRPEDDAQVVDGRIELLGDEFRGRARGRVWHKQPVQLWDGTTGEAASFTANFSFSIESVAGKGAASAGHGMTFFLAPYTPNLPQESYDGCLGLFDESQALNYSKFNASGDSRFVAVEFDIRKDIWDPSSQHIGIDINSMDSRGDYTVLPDGSLVDAGVISATVVYDNRTRSLRVTLMVGSVTYTSVATVDLRSLLPEKVAVGFSAATGDEYNANHTVLSFSFASTLATKNGTSMPVTVTSSTKKATLQLGAGAAAAALLVFLLVATVALLLVRRSSRSGKKPYDDEQLTTDGDDSLDAVDDSHFESSTGPKPIPYAQLAAATKDFAAEGKLGQGGSGSVYRGHLKESGLDVAIKVFSRGASMEGRKEYRAEVTVISRLRYRNLVQLIGWCHGRRRLQLVYELVSNGSLDDHLYSTEVTLTWPTRKDSEDRGPHGEGGASASQVLTHVASARVIPPVGSPTIAASATLDTGTSLTLATQEVPGALVADVLVPEVHASLLDLEVVPMAIVSATGAPPTADTAIASMLPHCRYHCCRPCCLRVTQWRPMQLG